ncbi:hypothetical protein A2Z67_04535 [Candidatus Woesebacteria bacterium RBG_13_36_22]|uniref:Uncharacterized protein n=1 Tax=Candidatus Woesebacteria bacterium RBG_13_36_22 TaxID=1802478 RepID=A0A1F7X3B0_9BACT|nr:MAG: hypothetical protein A2Z67_04535 [Candidatus Woesebacteria bacterium RBG_13_36_22]
MRLYVNEPYYLEVLVTDGSGNSVSGLSIEYTITRLPDIEIEKGELTETSTGIYQKFVRFLSAGQYRVFYLCPNGYENGIETIIVEKNSFDSFLKRFSRYYPL